MPESRKTGNASDVRFYETTVVEDEKYIEENVSEVYYFFDAKGIFRLAYNPYGKEGTNILFEPKGTRYATFDEAVNANNRFNYGKEMLIKSVVATSVLIEGGKTENKYAAENLIDGTYKSWVEGKKDSGIGTKITFEFEKPYYFQNYTNYACIYIQNGFGDLKYFHQNNRIKEMNVWIDDSTTPVKVRLYDFHVPQCIVLRKYLGEKLVHKITLEILSVYPGTKYDDTCIAEIHIGSNKNYDGNAVYPFDPYLSEITYAYYRDIEKNTSNVRINNGIFEVQNPGSYELRPGWWPIDTLTTSF